ncbi:MAG: hypothetical protein GY838_01165 [bacterium]|nr:hypothetical protein [bacterium]
MTFIATAMNTLFDLLAAPFGASAGWAVAVLSALIGGVMLLLFKWATNQDELVNARRVLTGRIYEMGLFQDHLSVLGKIQRDLAVANFKYLRWSLPALLVLLPPMVLILAQMDARYGHRPFLPGEQTLVTVAVAEDQSAILDGLILTAASGVTVETRPVRDHRRGLVHWRVRVDAAGDHQLTVTLPDGRTATKRIVGGEGTPRLARVREREGLVRVLLNPAEPPLPGDLPVESIALVLPDRRLDYGFVRTNWLVALIVFSLVAGLALKDVFRVRF